MIRVLFIFFTVALISINAFTQQQFNEKFNSFNEVIETDNPDLNDYAEIQGLIVTPVKWVPYSTDCRDCRDLANQYNDAMQELFNVRAYIVHWEYVRDVIQTEEKNKQLAKDAVADINSRLENITVSESKPLTEKQIADALSISEFRKELIEEHIPTLQRARDQLVLTTKNLRIALTNCEIKCVPPEERKELVSLPGNEIIQDPALPFEWNGPYYEVCEACRRLAARLNELYGIGIDNVNELNTVNAKLASIRARIFILEITTKNSTENREQKLRIERLNELGSLRRDLKDAEKDQKRILKNQDKIIKNFNETLAKHQECIKTCPPQKNACVFPDELFAGMTIGPNDEVGSSAQAAKEMRDKVSGAAKGAATKAIGNLIGFGGFGCGGSKGPKTDKDRTKGDFTRISSGDTDLDIRAGWRDDQLIVSTEIDESPDNGTFHAQWIEDKDGNTYLPVRYMIFKMYRDWKLTVSWTEDHYVNGEHVFHDEGQEISTGRDLLGTWTLFEGAEGIANSIWGMLGFDTATKGVRHLGAVYDIPAASFPDDCQMQLVTHVSQPSKDPVTTLPIVGDLFKHVDESKRRPETMVLIQPHIMNVEE